MLIPSATYRIQFNCSFGFSAAQEMIPYLAALGISHVYASPIFKARPGSTHGYDIVDPNQVSAECGGFDALKDLLVQVKKQGLYWLQDIVPNHMAFDPGNAMLMDVFEHGEHSPYFNVFDIDWNHSYEDMNGRLLAPFLGKIYTECLEQKEIQLQYNDGTLSIGYYDYRFPLKIESYSYVFEHNINLLEQQLSGNHADFIKFLGALELLKSLASSKTGENYAYQIRHAKSMLWNLYSENITIRQFIDGNIAVFNGEEGNPSSFDALDQLLSEQLFRLSYWKVAAEEINYRRFFTVNDLISVKVEDPDVFEHTHALLFKLLADGMFNGLRIDHIDGLSDPFVYLKQVRAKAADIYIVVEKILEQQERIPSDWPVQGTTGYDFLNFANGLFCRQENKTQMSAVYNRFTDTSVDYEQLLTDKKRLIIAKHMAGNIDNLAQFMKKISSRQRYGRDITLYGLRRALVEVMAHFPVYRTYISNMQCTDTDAAYIKQAILKAREKSPGLQYEISFIEKFLLMQCDPAAAAEDRADWLQLTMNFQQYTGPLMAKGFEDTFLYVYNRLISLNDVGSNPASFGVSSKEFHDFNEYRSSTLPLSMNATSTHDTKRGEDVRARINVLSEIPREWESQAKLWSKLNRAKKKKVGNRYLPDENDEYFIYQTLLGTYPFGDEHKTYTERIKNYIIKAVREAKFHTAWIKPDSMYEDACSFFVESILTPADDNHFLREFQPVQRRIAFYGIFNSLSQTLLKIASPGVPDFYQGTELWELNLVDPDNRRPVDFTARYRFLQDIIRREQGDLPALVAELLASREDGRIKQFLIYRALKIRNHLAEVFQQGSYLPLMTDGAFKKCVIAFARKHENRWIIAVAPRFLTTLVPIGEDPLGEQVWRDTRLIIPDSAPENWRNTITGEEVTDIKQRTVGSLLKIFPAALLVHDDRGA